LLLLSAHCKHPSQPALPLSVADTADALVTVLTLSRPALLSSSLQVCQFQRLLFKHWPQLRDLSLANCAAACAPDGLRRALAGLKDEELQHLVCKQLRLVGEDDPWAQVGRGWGFGGFSL
jgi:hypothetical protein